MEEEIKYLKEDLINYFSTAFLEGNLAAGEALQEIEKASPEEIIKCPVTFYDCFLIT